MALAETLDLVRRREQAEAWDRNESQLATSLSTVLPAKSELDDETRGLIRPFLDYCALVNVRYLPARPTTVASFVFKQFDAGVKPDTIFDQLAALERLHDSFDLANPVATSAARAALSEVASIEVPRSWPKADKELFKTLPPQIRNVILNREKDRETTLRRAQNEAGELRNALKRLTAPAASTQAADNTEKGIDTNAK
jgi:hypothetical protein